MRSHIHTQVTRHKPEGLITRGKTARNRLRRVDTFLLAYDPGLLSRKDGPFKQAMFVDLGYGSEPITTLESAQRLRQANPDLIFLGVEIDPERVANAQPFADQRTIYRMGGFNLPLQTRPDGTPETVRAVRAFNVLRQYDEDAVAGAYERLFQHILPGGLLIEGTSNPFGSIWVANLARRCEDGQNLWDLEALVFSTNFRMGFNPAHFQPVLPKSLIHRIVPGEPIYGFFQAWKRAAAETASVRVWGARQWFVASAQSLARCGYRINLKSRWLRKGWLIWERPVL